MTPKLLAVLTLGLLTGAAAARDDFRRSPFRGVRWVPEVEVGGRWYQLRQIDGLPVEEVIDHLRRQKGDEWARRFAEDLVEALAGMGSPVGETVTLTVRDPDTGKEQTLDKVPVTKANRDAVLKARYDWQSRPAPPLRPRALAAALDAFAAAINDRWSYRHANAADFPAAVAALRKRDDLTADALGVELQKVVALGIDGHAEVEGFRLPRGGRLPFLLEPHGDRLVAFAPDRSGFVAAGFPYLATIDGRPAADWLAAAAALVPKGSPQYVRQHGLRQLRELDFVRGLLGLPKPDTVEVELLAADGVGRKTLTLPVAGSLPTYGVWPRGGSRLLDGNVGYLRLADMTAAPSVAEIKQWMPRFRDTAGLVVDVRDNGGGDRDALTLLHSFLAAPGSPPRVVAAAAYRLHPAHRPDHLARRFMHRADAKEWSDPERRAVAAFAAGFKPQWLPPAGQFSDWHCLVLGRTAGPGVFHYAKPVVVLMNGKCFSATDVFLAGLKGLPNVTLLGTPSGGGSSFAQKVPLGPTPLKLLVGSMASFQPDGRLFDGNGVPPDVPVEPAPAYHVGGPDDALAAALERIRKG